ncbi:MAG: dihydrodipicolinate synthase family protein [Chloroflexi bacterium]|nr:dihydrodipicolinate synthase family protein [Chloroflexota bacterium]MCL5026207.1 dihydrodipicolinate synthase family protein [Chloroflexota bacterium]
MSEAWRGIFTILLTPFDENGALDEESLAREVDFVIAAGCHGIVTPVNTSEFALLADEERRRLAEVVVSQAKGRVPVVIGVAASNAITAAALARHAKETGANGVIAMPPYVVRLGPTMVEQYYTRIAEAAGGLPVVIQNVGGSAESVGAPLSPEDIVRLAEKVPAVRYVKEETTPCTHRITALLKVAGNRLSGVFGGTGGRYLIDELQRGSCGLMSACHLVDAQVKVFNLLSQGKEEEARAIWLRQLPVQNMWSLLGLGVPKEVLRRRGVLKTTVCRRPTAPLDNYDHAELDKALAMVREDLVAFSPV